MARFKDSLEGAEDFPNADAWIDNIKFELAKIKPDWSKEDVDGFLDAFFDKSLIVNAFKSATAKLN